MAIPTPFFQRHKSVFFVTLGLSLTAIGIGVFLYTRYYRSAITRSDDDMPQAEHIYAALDKYRITYDIDTCSVDSTCSKTPVPFSGVSDCIDQIVRFVKHKLPINMVIVSFPFKSTNRDKKVIGLLPDMAERRSLEYLHGMLKDIKRVYKPGAELLILCDGMVFASVFGIPSDWVIAYESALRILVSDLPGITLLSSQDFVRKHKLKSVEEIVPFIESFAPSKKPDTQPEIVPESVSKRVALEFDYPHGQELLKRQPLAASVGLLMHRERALQNYVSKTFASPEDYLRLSVHFSKNVGKKFGIKLSPTGQVTPYHGVLVEQQDGSWTIMFKKDVPLGQYELTSQNIQGIDCPYYKRINE